MASRSRASRYEPRHDSPYMSREPYPDPSSPPSNAYEYVGSDAFDEPPRHTFDANTSSPPPPRRSSPPRYSSPPRRSSPQRRSSPPRHSSPPRRSSPRRRHKSSRASTQPPQYSRQSPPLMSRRAASPVLQSPRRDASSSPRQSRWSDSPRSKAAVAAKQKKHGRWIDKPAMKNVGKFGRKGLHTLGDFVDAYAAAQGAPEENLRGRSVDRDAYGGRHSGSQSYHDRDRHSHRRRYSPSSSPSPPRRRSRRHGDRERPTMNGRHKSFSTSPAPLSRGPEYDDQDRGRHRHRRHRTYSSSPSVSPSPRRHRHRRTATSPPRPRSGFNSHMRSQMKAPNPDIANRWQMAARAALEAGGVTAFRLRKEPGSWAGEKGARVATAALGAAAIDAFIDKDPRRSRSSGGGVKGMAQNAIGGILASKLMGMKSFSTRGGRSRY